MKTYDIHESKTGTMLVRAIDLDEAEVETVSSDNAEGHFRADRLHGIADLGDVTVYALEAAQ